VIATASIAAGAATAFGMMAASIAVFGFAAHVKPALSNAGDRRLREATVIGGIAGLAVSLLVMVLSAFVG
jgi:hypothetical protein